MLWNSKSSLYFLWRQGEGLLQMHGITLFGLKLTILLSACVMIRKLLKPERKKKIPFVPVEIRAICQCLMERRNREIQAKRYGAVDALNELLIQFAC